MILKADMNLVLDVAYAQFVNASRLVVTKNFIPDKHTVLGF